MTRLLNLLWLVVTVASLTAAVSIRAFSAENSNGLLRNVATACDGTANSAPAMQVLFDQMNEQTELKLPANLVCIITSGIDIRSNRISIDFNRSVIKKVGSSAFDAITVSGSHVSIRNFDEDGNRLGGSGLTIRGRDISVFDSKTHNNGAHGVIFQDAVEASISGCQSYSNSNIGVAASGGVRLSIVACSNISENGGEGITLDNATIRSKVIGNNLRNNGTIGCFGGIGAGNASNSNTIRANLIVGTMHCGGIAIEGRSNIISNNRTSRNNGAGVLVNYVQGYISSNNRIEKNTIDEKIAVRTIPGSSRTLIGPNALNNGTLSLGGSKDTITEDQRLSAHEGGDPLFISSLPPCGRDILGMIAVVTDGFAGLQWGYPLSRGGSSEYTVLCAISGWTVAGE